MKKSIVVALAVFVLLAGVLAYAANQDGVKTYSLRYKLTVSVDTPEGLKTGSAVREATVKFDPRPGYKPHPYHVTTKVRGEAVVVDLDKRGALFALIDPDDYRFVFEAFPGPSGLTLEGAEYYANLPPSQKASLDKLPWLVTFADRSEPKTIKAITKANISDIFGQGVNLKGVDIEIATDAITWGVLERYLEWFGTKRLGLGLWDPKNPEAEKYLTSSNFRLGKNNE